MTFPSFHDPTHLYFITASLCGWKNLFLDTSLYNTLPVPSHPSPLPAPSHPSPLPAPSNSSLLPVPSHPSSLPAPSPAQVIPNPYAQIVLDSLAWLGAQKKISLFAFVLMPSHLHAILKPEAGTIAEVLQDFGSFTAHGILSQLREENERELLEFFHRQRRDKRHGHSIWQDIQARNIFSEEFLNQKLEYVHNNPVGKDWQLVRDRADYPYSSASFYDHGQAPMIEVTDIREWLCVDTPPRTAA